MEEKSGKKEYASYSEFSMGALDFERFNKILQTVDECAFYVRQYPSKYIVPYFSILKQFNFNLMPLMTDEQKKNYKNKFKEIVNDVYQKRNLENCIEKLEAINIELLQIRQDVGLGIVTTKPRKKHGNVLSL